ncbi:PABC domain-containing protein, partial [Durusdinium trenchii]
AALSLQSAVRSFLANSRTTRMSKSHVVLKHTCEINPDCQEVLAQTYGNCNFSDILSLDLTRQTFYCTTHKKMCNVPQRTDASRPVCIFFSAMGLRQGTNTVGFATHQAYYERVAPHQDVIIVENVPEYQENTVMGCLPGGNRVWRMKSIRLDPRVLGLPTARARVFMIIYKYNKVQWNPKFHLETLTEHLCSQVVMSAESYFWKKVSIPKQLSEAEERNLRDYHKLCPGLMVMDLSQYPKNGRGRGNTVDGCMCTLTTSSGRIYGEAKHRVLHGEELLSTHVLPVTATQARKAGAPKLALGTIKDTSQAKMAGNAMSVPCIGLIIMAAIMGLERV